VTFKLVISSPEAREISQKLACMRQSALFLETCKAYYGTARQSTESNLQCMVLHTVQVHVLVKILLEVLLKFRRWIKLNDDDDDGTWQFGYV